MTDETDATKVLADIKSVGASLEADETKASAVVKEVKAWYKDYRTYLVCVICFLIGAFVGHKL